MENNKEDSYPCPVCGLWCKKDGGHQHVNFIECEHHYVPYYVNSSTLVKMMCRKCLKVDYLKG